MNWSNILFEVIDMRSFSNLWYWIMLAVVWSMLSHWVIGVPFDAIRRAARRGGAVQIELEDLVRINCNRLLYIAGMGGLWILGLSAAGFTSLALLGFWYKVEFAQAVFLLIFPVALAGLITLNNAAMIRNHGLEGDALHDRLFRHRVQIQFLGMFSIFLTALWGMYQNLNIGALH